MSPAPGPVSGSGSRSALAVLAITVLAIGLALLARATPRQELLDPSSGAPNGARGLRLLLAEVGADVSVGADVPTAGDGVDRLVVLVDRLSERQRSEALSWADRGGVLVVADPDSPMLADLAAVAGAATPSPSGIERADCSIGSLQKLRALSLTVISRGDETIVGGTEDARYLHVPELGSGCFGSAREAFVVAAPRGAGLVVGLGENRVFSNVLLSRLDNAPLATALLAPSSGTRVRILRGTGSALPDHLGGDRTLLDLVRPGVWMGIVLGAVAFVVLAAARGIRVGRPVVERPPVPIAAAALVSATGNLLERARHDHRAGELLRFRLHRDLCNEFGVDPTAPLEMLDDVLVARAGLAPGRAVACLAPAPDGEPVEVLADRIHRLREDLL